MPEKYIPPEPVVYTGNGDDVIEITPPDDLWAFRISGNSGAHHFSVTGYAENGEYNDLFVNTTEPYSGITLDQSQTTTMLEIKAEGEWTVELISFGVLDVIYGGDTYTGTGDMVFLMYDYGKGPVLRFSRLECPAVVPCSPVRSLARPWKAPW